MMSKHAKNLIITIACALVTFALSFVQWHHVLPTGTQTIAVAGVFALAAMFAVGIWTSLILLVVVAILTTLLHITSWLFWLPILLDWFVLAGVNGWRMTNQVHLHHQQAISFGLIAGTSQLAGKLVLLTVQVVWMTGNFTDVPRIIEAATPGALLEGLLYAALVPPILLLLRFFTEELPTKRNKGRDAVEKSSKIIDLSEHKEKNDQK